MLLAMLHSGLGLKILSNSTVLYRTCVNKTNETNIILILLPLITIIIIIIIIITIILKLYEYKINNKWLKSV